MTGIKTLVDMGIKVKAQDARDAVGVSKPADGEEVIQPPQQPGAPGAGGPPGAATGGPPPGGADNPLAALMGGGEGGGTPGAEEAPDDAAGGEEPSSPDVAQAEEPQGDFLDALRHMREEHERERNVIYDRLAQLGSVLR